MPNPPHQPEQLELNFTVSPDVTVTRFPEGEIRIKPAAPKIVGTTEDAARVLRTSRRTILRLIAEKEIPAFKPAKRAWVVDMLAVYERRKAREQEAQER